MAVRAEYYEVATKSSPFYGTASSLMAATGQQNLQLQSVQLPASWLVQSWSGWEGWTPRDWTPRVQGWKIHVSATPRCAERTLSLTTEICLNHQVAFKFLPILSGLIDSSSKQGDRGSAGKFITIYPDDDAQMGELLHELAKALDGQEGPYILSDLRFGDVPVFVRYGAILGFEVPDVDDRAIDSIVDVASMRLVPDRRSPRFIIPEGVDLPAVLQPAYAASQESTESRLDDFTTIKPLHFSNAGGVYRAELPDGSVRVLREARPHAGLDARNRCALQRQHTEQKVLEDLAGIEGVQNLRGVFTAWEHRFLELDYVEGTTLTSWVVRNCTLQETDPVDYARQAVAIIDQLVAIVERIHDRGWALGDVHTGNMLVSEDGVVTVLDLEDATRLDQPREIGFRVFEYCADESLNAEQADWFAIARSIMMIYYSDFEIEAVSPQFWLLCCERVRKTYGDAAAEQLEAVERRYPASARCVLASSYTVGVPETAWTSTNVVPALMSGIEWSRQFSEQNCFPGDVTQGDRFAHEVISSGRAGVLLAQQRIGQEPAASDVDALEVVARSWTAGDSPGLINGLAGIALTLSEMGRHESAVAAASQALRWSLGRRRLDVMAGQAGTIIGALEVAAAAKDEKLTANALEAYDRLHRSVHPSGSAWTTLCRRRGYFWGLTGLALTDLVAHTISKDPDHLHRARTRLRADLDACVTLPNGEVLVSDVQNNRVLPYIEWGSAGLLLIASVIERLSGEAVLTAPERDGIVAACSSEFYIYPGLDHGQAGIAVTLDAAGFHHEAERQTQFVRDRLLECDGHALSIGDGLIRLSSDLGTGAAGVALALHSIQQARPFLILPISRSTADIFHARPQPDFATVTPIMTIGKQILAATSSAGRS